MSEIKAGATSRRFGTQFVSGAALGFAGSCFFGPGVLSWWYEPPIKDAFSCASSVRSALSQFVKMQLTAAVIGGAGILIIVFLVRRALGKRDSQTPAPSTGA